MVYGPSGSRRRADRQERVGASGQVPGGGIDVRLQHRVEPAAGIRVEVALRVAEERSELAGVGVERRRHAVEHVQAERRRRVLVLLRVEQADRQVDLLPEEGRGAEPPAAQALVRRLNLEALREHGVADVQALEPGLHLVGGDLLPGDARRLQRRGALARADSSPKRRSSSAANCCGRGQIAVCRPVRRVFGGGSGLADIHGAELLDRDGGPGGVRRDGHPERQRGGAGGGYEARDEPRTDATCPPLRKLSACDATRTGRARQRTPRVMLRTWAARVVRALTGTVALALVLAGAPAANAARHSGVSGRASHEGPVCGARSAMRQPRRPGNDKLVRARSGRLVRTVHTDTGRFRIGLLPVVTGCAQPQTAGTPPAASRCESSATAFSRSSWSCTTSERAGCRHRRPRLSAAPIGRSSETERRPSNRGRSR